MLDATVLVGGTTAESVDYFDIVGSWLPIVFAFVLGLSFILLTVAFRSIVIPAVAIVLNLLSVGAAYGLLVLVFQKGVGNELFGFQQVDTIEAWVPLFLFSVLFGLSMDYQVFLLSRIKERYTQTGDTAGAVSFGVGSTARLITGAALIIIAVFSGFAAGDLVMFQQMGFGVAVALLVDATIVRCVLVPASMKLLGERNWYLPSWLSWVPDVHVEGHAAAEPPDSPDSPEPPATKPPETPIPGPRPRRVRPYTTRKRKGSMTSVSHTTSLPPAVTLGRPADVGVATRGAARLPDRRIRREPDRRRGRLRRRSARRWPDRRRHGRTAQWLALRQFMPWHWIAATSTRHGRRPRRRRGSCRLQYRALRSHAHGSNHRTRCRSTAGARAPTRRLRRRGCGGRSSNPPAWALAWLISFVRDLGEHRQAVHELRRQRRAPVRTRHRPSARMDVPAERVTGARSLSLDRATGALLIGLPIAFNVFFFLLGRLFEYPAMLRSPVGDDSQPVPARAACH